MFKEEGIHWFEGGILVLRSAGVDLEENCDHKFRRLPPIQPVGL